MAGETLPGGRPSLKEQAVNFLKAKFDPPFNQGRRDFLTGGVKAVIGVVGTAALETSPTLKVTTEVIKGADIFEVGRQIYALQAITDSVHVLDNERTSGTPGYALTLVSRRTDIQNESDREAHPYARASRINLTFSNEDSALAVGKLIRTINVIGDRIEGAKTALKTTGLVGAAGLFLGEKSPDSEKLTDAQQLQQARLKMAFGGVIVVSTIGVIAAGCSLFKAASDSLEQVQRTPQGTSGIDSLTATLPSPGGTRIPSPSATPGVETQVVPIPEIPTNFAGTTIDTAYLIKNGGILAAPVNPDLQPQPTPIPSPDVPAGEAIGIIPIDYTKKTFALREFKTDNPMDVLKYVIAQGARQGTDGGVTYYQSGLNGEEPAFSELALYREKIKNPQDIEYVIQEGYPTGLVLRDGSGITVVGTAPDGNVVIAFEEYLDRGQPDFFQPRIRYASVPPSELGRISKAFLPTMKYFTDKPDKITYMDSQTQQERTVQLNTIDPTVMVELEKEIKGNWIDKYEDPNAEHGFTLYLEPFARYPDPEKDEIPEGIDIANLTYSVTDAPHHRGKPQSVKILATDQEENLLLVGEYNEAARRWKWRKIHPQDTPLFVSGSQYVLGKIEGTKFVEGDKQTRMTGAICTKFVTQNSADNPRGVSLPAAKKEIDALVGMGANFVIFEWNSGEEYLGNTQYVPSLVEAIKYANSRGLRVELILHSRGKDPNTDWKEKQITVLDDKIVSDWQALLADENVSGDLADCVDIFGVLAEAEWDTSHNRVSIYNPNLWNAAAAIRTALRKPEALCTFSIGEWGGEAQELLRVPQDLITKIQNEKIIIEIHQYLEQNKKRDLAYILELQAKGIPIMIGETGQLPWDDHDLAQEYYQEVLNFIKEHGLSFAWFAMDIFNTNPKDRNIHIYNGNGITEWGRKVQSGFVNYVP